MAFLQCSYPLYVTCCTFISALQFVVKSSEKIVWDEQREHRRSGFEEVTKRTERQGGRGLVSTAEMMP